MSSSHFGTLVHETSERPRQCSAFAFMYWRDKLDKQCPECGCVEIFYWLDGAAGLVCSSLDCEWAWVHSDRLLQEIDGIFNGS